MNGFLSRLGKKPAHRGAASDLLVTPAPVPPNHTASKQPSAPAPRNTKFVTADTTIGSPDTLLAELQAEEKALRRPPSSGVKSSGSLKPPSAVGKNTIRVPVLSQEPPASDSVRISLEKKKNADVLSDSLPWWLTDPVVSSPQVDLLVPAARHALNDLISDNITREELAAAIRKAVNIAADRLSQEVRLTAKDLADATQELISMMLGKGPLQPLYDDPAVTDIYLDGHASIKCLRRGQALETPFKFRSQTEYEAFITTMLQSVDRVLNMSSPLVDCVLDDQWRSRISAVHSSLLDGAESALVIRIPRLQQISFYDMLRTKTLPAPVAAWLAELVSCGEANIMVCGPTGSGKTTLTTALLSAVGSDERICTIEDVPEIFVPTIHLEKLVSRPENSQGEGAVGMDKLLRAALRRAPHRIVVGEIRDREGPLFLKALETGHAGSVATIHADNPRDSLWRLLDVVAAYEDSPQESLQRRIARSLHILISMKKVNGRPCMIEIAEVRPPVAGEFVVKTLVKFVGENGGKRQWRIMAIESNWIDRLAERGMELRPGPALLPYDRSQELYRDVEE